MQRAKISYFVVAVAPIGQLPPGPGSPLPPPSPLSDKSLSQRRTVTVLVVAFLASMLVLAIVCNLRKGYRRISRARAIAAALRVPLPEPPASEDDLQLRRAGDGDGDDRPATAGLPSFAYSPPAKHDDVESGGDAATATCSVCLAAFQLGETVRLLPACLHMYHVDCIDPWLDAHPTCPLCRSGTDPAMDDGRLPPA